MNLILGYALAHYLVYIVRVSQVTTSGGAATCLRDLVKSFFSICLNSRQQIATMSG